VTSPRSHRYEPVPDRNEQLRQELIAVARQKPRYGYRRLHVLLERRGWKFAVDETARSRVPEHWRGTRLRTSE